MKCSFLACIILFPIFLFAQTNYKSGYVVKINGDTLRGFINQKEWNHSPHSILFKVADNEPSTQFGPDQIRSFSVNGTRYIRHSGHLSNDKNQFPDLPDALDTSTVIGTIFLKEIATGQYLTLYSHSDNRKERYFVSDQTSDTVELKHHQYYVGNKLRSQRPYLSKLRTLTDKYATENEKARLLAELYKFEFLEGNLRKFIQKLNKVEKHQRKHIAHKSIFLGIGFNQGKTAFDGIYENKFSVSNTMAPRLSAGIDFYNNPSVKRFIFRSELSFSYIKADMRKAEFPYYTFNQYTGSISPQLIYNFYNRENFKFFAGGGVNFNFSSYTNNQYGVMSRVIFDDHFQLESTWTNFPVLVGLLIKKRIDLSISYFAPMAYTKYNNFSVSTETVGVNVHYFFKNKTR